MEDIKQRVLKIKRYVNQRLTEEQNLRRRIKSAVATVFPGIPDQNNLINNFYEKNGKLFLKTRNKTIANEVFLKRQEILKRLKNKTQINEIVVS